MPKRKIINETQNEDIRLVYKLLGASTNINYAIMQLHVGTFVTTQLVQICSCDIAGFCLI